MFYHIISLLIRSHSKRGFTLLKSPYICEEVSNTIMKSNVKFRTDEKGTKSSSNIRRLFSKEIENSSQIHSHLQFKRPFILA